MATPRIIDLSILQTALLQVAEATKAASEAAKAASVVQQRATSSTGGANTMDWSMQQGRPRSRVSKIDWSWQVCQYLGTIDANYDDELKKLFDDPSKALICPLPQWKQGHGVQNCMGCLLHLCVANR